MRKISCSSCRLAAALINQCDNHYINLILARIVAPRRAHSTLISASAVFLNSPDCRSIYTQSDSRAQHIWLKFLLFLTYIAGQTPAIWNASNCALPRRSSTASRIPWSMRCYVTWSRCQYSMWVSTTYVCILTERLTLAQQRANSKQQTANGERQTQPCNCSSSWWP